MNRFKVIMHRSMKYKKDATIESRLVLFIEAKDSHEASSIAEFKMGLDYAWYVERVCQ